MDGTVITTSMKEEPMTKTKKPWKVFVRNPRYRGATMDDVAQVLLRRKSREELIAERKAEKKKSVNPSV